jgi:hypothetical protein
MYFAFHLLKEEWTMRHSQRHGASYRGNKSKTKIPRNKVQLKGHVQPQTDAWTPRFFEPQTPLLVPHPEAKAFSLLLTLAWLDVAEADRSFTAALSLGVKPRPSGEGNGVVERLFKAGLVAWLVAGWEGRDPMGPTEPMAALGLDDSWRDDGDSAPPGDEVDVVDCSTLPS